MAEGSVRDLRTGRPARTIHLARPRPRTVVAALALVGIVAAGAYLAAGAYVYSRVAAIGEGCRAGATGFPNAYTLEDIDTSPYLMPNFEDVRFPGRDPRITVAGWFVPGALGTRGPAVIVVHGLGDCRKRPYVLLPAGMLHKNAMSVLVIDYRDHGDSTYEDGRHAGGTEEYLEVLGAWDWLRARGFDASQIGLFGESLGAATVLVAGGEEPRVAAVWADSSYGDLRVAIDAELTRNGYPTFLGPDAVLAARLMSGDDLGSRTPVDEARKLAQRAVFITHGSADTRLAVRYADDLAAAINRAGGKVEPWIMKGANHIEGVVREPAEYERRLAEFFSTALRAP